MPANDKISDLQFRYDNPELGTSGKYHRIQAFAGPNQAHVGEMLWTSKRISNILVGGQFQRRGVATSMWNEGHRLASENARIPAPKHSSDRTNAGDAWARAVGGRVPRRS
jgi:hypothetical protein